MTEQEKKTEESQTGSAVPQAMNDGTTLAINLVVSVLVGMAMGYGIDSLTGTKPLFLLVFMVLGFVAGIRKVMQATETREDED